MKAGDLLSFDFLKQLLHTPSPSGYEQKIQQVVRAWAKPFADETPYVVAMVELAMVLPRPAALAASTRDPAR